MGFFPVCILKAISPSMAVNRSVMADVSLQVDRFWQLRESRKTKSCSTGLQNITPISQLVEIPRESVREHRDVGVHQPLRGGGDGGT